MSTSLSPTWFFWVLINTAFVGWGSELARAEADKNGPSSQQGSSVLSWWLVYVVRPWGRGRHTNGEGMSSVG